MDDLFLPGAQTTLNLHSKKLIEPDATMILDMNLHEGDKLYLFEGIRHLFNEHKAFFQAYLPKDIGEKIHSRGWKVLSSFKRLR